ncbi:hypothetical protein T4B_2705 [Trichinella pseudospiralis]|uniref:Uncharacterized protein n=1 Tax=Trichinella pseudospiralis TaxID=6337 RepID=A0A0V1IE99_TRIPS|nr:hypothetical protein T4B_2705 [Trichinella pseudospiralis]
MIDNNFNQRNTSSLYILFGAVVFLLLVDQSDAVEFKELTLGLLLTKAELYLCEFCISVVNSKLQFIIYYILFVKI